VPDFSDFSRNSYDLAKFTESATFHPLHAQKSVKMSDMFKGVKKFAKRAASAVDSSPIACAILLMP
jgi:hypothetical protein